MHALRKSLCCLAFFSLSVVPGAFGQDQSAKLTTTSQSSSKTAGWAAAEKSVTKLEQDWFKIQLAHDWDKMHDLLGDDFQLIESDGRLGDRESMIAGYKEEAPWVVTISMTLLVSHAVANDAVVATGLDDITLKDKDGKVSHRYERFTDVWVLRKNKWVCVAEQLTLAHP
jgi:ketosteroid isomerase-like protein